MKNTRKELRILTIIAVFIFSTVACFGQTINSPEALKAYLDSQPINGPEKPIRVNMAVNDLMLKSIVDVIKSAGKYVSFNITGNTLTTIPQSAFEDCKTLVGITIPSSVTSIKNATFKDCTNLKSITIPDSVTSIEGGLIRDTTGGFGDVGAFYGCTSLTSVTIPYK